MRIACETGEWNTAPRAETEAAIACEGGCYDTETPPQGEARIACNSEEACGTDPPPDTGSHAS